MARGPSKDSAAETAPKKGDKRGVLGFEAKPWAAADAMRNNMSIAEST